MSWEIRYCYSGSLLRGMFIAWSNILQSKTPGPTAISQEQTHRSSIESDYSDVD